jgi:hypothetical protein
MAVRSEQPVKDDQQRPVPAVWRPVLSQVVEAIRAGEPQRAGDNPLVEDVPPDIAEHIVEYVADYGATLVPLPDASWDTSVTLWQEDRWAVLVDLWTEEEGRSDLVLEMNVFEVGEHFRFRVVLVYVP